MDNKQRGQIIERFSHIDRRFMFGALALSAAVFLLAGAGVEAWNSNRVASAPAINGEAKTHPGAPWGIRVVGVRSTAAGYMLEFRYRVTDAHKAAALFERKTKPYLSHSASGKVLEVPTTAKLGPLRNSNKPQEGRTYWMFFGNAGRLVQPGDKVTVSIGDFEYADLTVE
ncbi:MAG: hypothetical protein R6X15_09960 [Pseudomonadota bacterium]